ncbi:pyruvate:ferredoxin (flavodoxin) oxidoreductase [Mailhella massiliensis]|uniref:Pyruvate:ferredoxin oxidoreductase n=1 Tax=Mailhella massiliensis TaxID=1903261 RepID=A0A921AWC9_9BACT|nr:pyruvate:ferredoxin (flavodoxin) oxidoreductase [Mailhella massiliensis]HJD96973.1 pyruvate:ferredoxin (flavodoxin) oxidoreductase [Mailhella massiliensis]
MRRTLTMDGNTAAAHVSYFFTEVAAIYPITPSSPMAELTDAWAAAGRKNLFGSPVRIVEMQSEGGAAGALHGALQSGALASTYTASQGLLLMIPNMYKIAGELLPAVFHVSARSLASNSLSIFGDHQDVMATRQTGFALLASSSVQDVMYLGAVAHLAAIESRIPFLHFFDGFRTSHEIQRIHVLEEEELAGLLNREAVDAFRRRALNPDHPQVRGMTQNPDIFFQLREAVNPFVDALPAVVEKYMNKINELTGSNYAFFNYHGHPEAESIIVIMGSGASVVEETVDALNARGEKVGMINVRLYRPFLPEKLLEAVPASVKRIAVMDRTKEPGSVDPLCLDVRNAWSGKKDAPLIVGGRYGLASKDFTPSHVRAVFENLAAETPRDGFTVGIVDDVTHASLPAADFHLETPGQTACKFWGFGSDGTVGANKSAIKIIGDHTDMYAQAYFVYDSRKSGGVTISHLRFGKKPIRSSYLVDAADFIACHNQSYVGKYDLLRGIKEGGTFLLNCMWSDEELEQHLPAAMKRVIAGRHIRFYTINAVDIALEIGLNTRINMIMQSAFFKLANIIPVEEACRYLDDAIVKSYGKKGQAVIDMNKAAVRRGIENIHEVQVPERWLHAEEENIPAGERPAFIHDVVDVMNRQEGDDLPVSAFRGIEDGSWPLGITAWEKRGAAVTVPVWNPDRCIQCNLCSFSCPHAAIRPRLLNEAEAGAAPAMLERRPSRSMKGMEFHLAVSVLDCTGCGVCVNACPAKEKALTMHKLESVLPEGAEKWEYAEKHISYKKPAGKLTVNTSQFLRPYQEFSGACAGCGETPYAKLVTQLFGDRMMISNAAGCSTVWSAGAPSVSYTTDNRGHGPAWGFSLFEDNAEYGFGMSLGVSQVRATLAARMKNMLEHGVSPEVAEAMQQWLEHKDEGEGTRERAEALKAALSRASGGADGKACLELLRDSDYFVKRSHWIFGGDGWAYDIGYGGLDHVLASGADVNVLVFDTEVYSNTGGQSSKATPLGAVAQFAAAGKGTRKKDLGLMAMSYGNVYVAQISLGANQAHTLRVLQEAESYPGPSLIIAYAPCINHGIRKGLAFGQEQAKRAVQAGYWSLYHFDPRRAQMGENPFVLDSGKPVADFREFLLSEVRYSALQRQFPERAEKLYELADKAAASRRAVYTKMAERM